MSVLRLTGIWNGVELCRAAYGRHSFPVHAHSEVHVGLIDAGIYAFRREAIHHRAEVGELVVFGPDMPHDGEAGGSEGYSYRQLLVPTTIWDEVARAEGTPTPRLHSQAPVIRNATAAAFVEQVFAGAWDGDPFLLDLALARLVEALSPAMQGYDSSSLGIESAAVAGAVALMEAHFADRLTTLDLAAAGRVSRFSLCRAFRSRYGVGPHAWLVGVRLRHARMLLIAGLAVADVAAACGFCDQSHLTRCFKRHFGVTPGALGVQRTSVQSSAPPLR